MRLTLINCHFSLPVELNIAIASYGHDDPGYGSQQFKINGIATGTKSRGFNVVVISHTQGTNLGQHSFDTYESASASSEMVYFINNFPNGSIVMIAAFDDASEQLSQEAKDYFSSLGSTGIASMSLRSSLAMLTAKGVPKPVWFAESYAVKTKGPSLVTATLRFPTP